MKLRTMTTVAPILCAALLAHCGVKDGETEKTATESTSAGSLLTSDSDAATQTIGSQVDLAASTINEGNDASSASALALLDSDSKATMTRFRNCEEKDATAVVTIKRSSERARSKENKAVSMESSHSSFSEKIRTFSLEGGEVNCASDGKRADLDDAELQGLKLDVAFTEQRAKSQTMTKKKSQSSKTHAFKSSNKGTRSVKILTKETADGVITVTKETTQSVERTLELTKKDGTTVSFASTVTTSDAAPLKIVVKRKEEDKSLVSRTIESGTLLATNKDGSKIETKFVNVKYEPTATERCTPVSGSIEGSIFAKDQTTASKTYVITFSAEDGSSIKYSDGTEADYDASGCELEDPIEKVSDKSSKDDVSAPEGSAPKAAQS